MISLYNELTQACSKEVTSRYSTSFFRAVNLLSASIQQDIHNIYGFVRFADEIVDTFHDFGDPNCPFASINPVISRSVSN